MISYLPFIVKDEALSPESRLILSWFLRKKYTCEIVLGEGFEPARATRVSCSKGQAALNCLIEAGYISKTLILRGSSKPLRRRATYEYEITGKLEELSGRNAISAERMDTFRILESRWRVKFEMLLGGHQQSPSENDPQKESFTAGKGKIKENANQARRLRPFELGVSARALLICLMAHANLCGVVRGLSREKLTALTGLSKDQLMNQTKKLVSLKILQLFIPGATGSQVFGMIPSVYCINRNWAEGIAGENTYRQVILPLSQDPSNFYWKYPWFDIGLGQKSKRGSMGREGALRDRVRFLPGGEAWEAEVGMEYVNQQIPVFLQDSLSIYRSGHLELKLAEYAGWILSADWGNFRGNNPWMNMYLLKKIQKQLMPNQIKNAHARKLMKIRKTYLRKGGCAAPGNTASCALSKRRNAVLAAEKDFAEMRKKYLLLGQLLYAVAHDIAVKVYQYLSKEQKDATSPPLGRIELIPQNAGHIRVITALREVDSTGSM